MFPPFPRDSKEEQPGRGSTASQLQGGQGGQGTAAIAGNACIGWVTWQENVQGWPSDRA